MNQDGVFCLTGLITDFAKWDDTINLFATQFHEKHNVYPNILLASDLTYRKIDLYAQMHPNRIVSHDGLETIENSTVPYTGISDFVTENYRLHCCMDNDLPEGAFTLVHDDDPDFDGEPVEKTEELERDYFYGVA